ncbi:MAG: hypothetical protein RTU92_05165 [Candidatus Thorarchaeota archaeon]
MRTTELIAGHRHAFQVLLPKRIQSHNDNDLRLMLLSLKNTRNATVVHIQRIERELAKRGVSKSLIRTDLQYDFDKDKLALKET